MDPKRRYTVPQIRKHRWVTSRTTFVVDPLQSPLQPLKRCERDLDECALRLMQNLGMDLHKITEVGAAFHRKTRQGIILNSAVNWNSGIFCFRTQNFTTSRDLQSHSSFVVLHFVKLCDLVIKWFSIGRLLNNRRHLCSQAIKTDAFNHYTAIYYLLLEKLLKHRTAYLNMANQGAISPTRNVALITSGTAKEAPPRRPSSVADQAVTPRPVLAETKQGPFSHTTDCVQVPLINLIDAKESDESRQTEILPNSQKKVSVDEGVDMECGSSCSRDDSQDLPFIPSGRRRYGSSRDALRDSSQNSSASFQSIGTGMSESPQASFDLEVDNTSGSLQHDAPAAQVFPGPSQTHPVSETKLRTSEPATRILHPSTLPRLPFTRTSLVPGSLVSPAVTMTPPFGAKFYHPNNGSSGLSVSGLVESGNGGSGCQVGGLDVRDARSPVNFREGRRASDEFLASAVKNNAVPFRQRLRETSKAWAVVTEPSCSGLNEAEGFSLGGDEANRNKDLESADQAMADFPSEERAQVLHRRNIWQTQLQNYLFKPSLLVPAAMVAMNPEVIPPALQFRFQHLQIDHSKPLDHRIIPHPIEYSIPQRTAMVPTQLESFETSNSSRVKRRRFVRQASYRLSQGSEGELSSSSWLPSSEPLSPTFEVMEDEEEDDDDEKTKEEKQPEEREVCDMECWFANAFAWYIDLSRKRMKVLY